MADRLEFDPVPASAEGGGRKLEFDTPSKEQELRAQYGKEIMGRGEPGYGERFLDAQTFGIMRPLSGAVRAIGGLGDPTSTAGERYRAGNAAAEDYFKKGAENTAGVGGFATDVAGSLVAPPIGKIATAGKLAAKGGRELLSRIIAQGATTGAVEGAARNSQDVGTAVQGAAVGAGLGAAGSAAVGGASKLIPGVKGAQKELREVNQGVAPQALRDEAKDFYKVFDSSGIAYAQPQTLTLKAGLDNLKATNQYNPIAHAKISDYVDQLDKLAQNPAGAKFSELHNLRSALATEARGPDESTRVAAGKVKAEIDKLVTGNQPAFNPQGVDLKHDYPEATRLWKASSIADDVGYTAGKAERKTLSKSGVNPDEANRGAFRPLLEKVEKPGAYSPFKNNPEQRDLLAKIVGGDTLQNVYRGAGNVAGSPITRGLAGLAATGLGISHGLGPIASGLGLQAAGGGAIKAALDRAAANRGAANIDALLRNITTGSSAPTNVMPSRQALAILQAKQAAQRGGAAYAGSLTGER